MSTIACLKKVSVDFYLRHMETNMPGALQFYCNDTYIYREKVLKLLSNNINKIIPLDRIEKVLKKKLFAM